MKHQQDLGLKHPKVRRAYWAMFSDSLEYNDEHLRFLKERNARYLQSLR
jgi:hypothetical protein